MTDQHDDTDTNETAAGVKKETSETEPAGSDQLDQTNQTNQADQLTQQNQVRDVSFLPGACSQALDEGITRGLITTALKEDLRYGQDVTTLATVQPTDRSVAHVTARHAGIASGMQIIAWTLEEVAAASEVESSAWSVDVRVADGDVLQPGQVLAEIEAPTQVLLVAERTMLNLLTHACGISTATSKWVEAVAGTGAYIRDSRKTLPGLRNLEKYAVACGGGVNHRFGLGDQAMIKDNHVVAAGGVVEALRRVREYDPDIWCEVEVDTLEQLGEVLPLHPDQVLLDNFPVWATQIAVQRRDKVSPGTSLESSGGLTLDKAHEYASCGVDYLAVGALTHSVTSLDLGVDFL